jgi:hypothetical protein
MLAAILPGGTTLHVVPDGESRYALTLEIDERTSARDLRAAGPTIHEWREGLARFQGLRIDTGIGGLFEQIDLSVEKKEMSYGGWAARFNSRISDLLRGFHDGVALDRHGQVVRASQLELGDLRDPRIARAAAWLRTLALDGGRRYALEILADLGFKKLAAEKIVADALGRLGAGKKAFLRGQPVSRDHMIGVVKTWRRRKTRRR